jgi:hypothetical protein
VARVIVPFTVNLMSLEPPGDVALADSIAVRREPGPWSFRLLTTNVYVYTVAGAEAWATADPTEKTTAAETPAAKLTAAAIRGRNRSVRLIRMFMRTTSSREKISLAPLPSLPEKRISNLKKYAQLSTR